MLSTPELVRTDDPEYVAKVALLIDRARGGLPPTGQRSPANDAQRMLEHQARWWLGARYTNTGDHRVLRMRRARPDEWGLSYEVFELDGVLGAVDQPTWFVEVKSTRRPAVAFQARTQVGSRVALGQQRWPGLRGAVMWIDTRNDDEVAANPPSAEITEDETAWLSSPDDIPILRLPASPLWDASVARGFGTAAEWEALMAPPVPSAPREGARRWGDSVGGGTLGDLLRRRS